MRTFSKKTHIVLIAIFIAVNAGFWIMSSNPTVPDSTGKTPLKNVRFYLEPAKPEDYFPDATGLYQTFVRTRPDSIQYAASYLYEEHDRRTQKYPLLFLAEKRFREIEEWRNNLNVINLHNATDSAQLLSWWNRTKPSIQNLQGFSVLGSYEAEIARYGNLILEKKHEIGTLTKEENRIREYGMLRSFIKTGYPRMRWAIENSKHDTKTKIYLDETMFNMQRFLIDTVAAEYEELDPSRVSYSLRELKNTGQFGRYKITINWPPQYDEIARLSSIKIQGKTLVNSDETDILSADDALVLSLPDLELLESSLCKKSQYVYPYPEFNTYLFSVEHRSENSIEYAIENQFVKKSLPIFHKELGKEHLLDTYHSVLNFPEHREDQLYVFRTNPTDPNIPCDHTPIRTSLKPIINPSIMLTKISSTASPTSPVKTSSGLNALLIWTMRITRILTIIYLLSLVPMILRMTASHLFYLWPGLQKRRIFLFIILLFGIAADIFFIAKPSEMLIFILYIFYLATTAAYGVGLRKQIGMSLLLLSAVPVAYLINQPVIADKLGVWAFITIFTAFIPVFIGKKIVERDALFTNMKADITKSAYYNNVIIFITRLFLTCRMQLRLYFANWPSTLAEGAILLWKSVLLVLGIISAIYLIYTGFLLLDNQVENYKTVVLLGKRTPTINSYGPQIVYHGTKVLIRGREFGYKQSLNVKLLSSTGEVETEFWSNDKIIFSAPLHWKPGVIDLWIEKPMLWEGGWHTISSNHFTIKLIPITGTFTKDDDDFYKQFKSLDKETLKINGY